jgi:hypothetical protein
MTSPASRFPGTACLLLCAAVAAAAEAPERRVYTNDDLDRIRGERGEVSPPAAPSPAASPAPPAGSGPRDRDLREEHWRREADRLRERLQPLRDQLDDLEEQADARWRTPGVKPVTDAKLRALQQKRAALEARIREAEERLEERARRAGALPGWLR